MFLLWYAFVIRKEQEQGAMERLAEFCERYCLSRRQIATALGIDYKTVCRWHANKDRLTKFRICALYGVLYQLNWKADEIKIIADYRAGVPVKTLRSKYGIGHIKMANLIKKVGGQRPNKSTHLRSVMSGIIQDYQAGVKLEAISATYNISLSSIKRVVSEAGLARRRGPPRYEKAA